MKHGEKKSMSSKEQKKILVFCILVKDNREDTHWSGEYSQKICRSLSHTEAE